MIGSPRFARTAGALFAVLAMTSVSNAQGAVNPDGKVDTFHRITTFTGGFGAALSPGDQFGDATVGIGDLDGNGVPDLAVSVPGEDDGGSNRGGVWILFMNSSGFVIDEQKISDTAGGFGGALTNNDNFGAALANVGDLDGDGRSELAVGTSDDRLFILFLDTDGTVVSEQEIGAATGGFSGALSAGDGFGSALGSAGDIDDDGIPDLAVGSPGDDDGGSNRGAIWILFLDTDGTVLDQQVISSTTGGLGAGLLNGDAFGTAVKGIEDLDGNGVREIAVGAPLTNGIDFFQSGPGATPIPIAAIDEGVIFILFMNDDGTVSSKVEIGEDLGGFTAKPRAGYLFGSNLAALGDLDGNGVDDLSVGTPTWGVLGVGGFYTLFLESDGFVGRQIVISDKQSGFNAGGFQERLLLPGDQFSSPAYVGDLDGNCLGDMVCGAPGDDAPGLNAGSIWVLLLKGEIQAQTTFRNGTGANTVAYFSTSEPRVGHDWTAKIEASSHAGATVTFIVGVDGPGTTPTSFGEVLFDLFGAEVFVDLVTVVDGVGEHSLAIPNTLSLVSAEIFSQGGIGGGAGPELLNAVDLKLGH